MTQAPAQPRTPPFNFVFELPSSGRQRVVGESHYQAAIGSAVGRRPIPEAGPDGWDLTPSVEATLRPEPTNPYDRWAVAVDLRGRCVGYLPREDARGYHGLLAALAAEGYRASCVAHVVRSSGGYLAVYLHLAGAEDVAIAVECRPYADFIGGRRLASVPASKDWQAQMMSVHKTQSNQPLIADLRFGVISKGKYAGLQCIDVFVGDVQIGSLTRRMTERYEARVAASLIAGRGAVCRVSIEKGSDELLRATLLIGDDGQS